MAMRPKKINIKKYLIFIDEAKVQSQKKEKM